MLFLWYFIGVVGAIESPRAFRLLITVEFESERLDGPGC